MIHAYSHRASVHTDAKDTPKETAAKFRSIEASKEASFGASIPSFALELSESRHHPPLIERRRASATIPSANQLSVFSNIHVETVSRTVQDTPRSTEKAETMMCKYPTI
jgi:hypothetical protein